MPEEASRLLLGSRVHAADPVVSGITVATRLRQTASVGFQLADPAGHIVTVSVCVGPSRPGGVTGPCTGATLVAQGTFDTPDGGSAFAVAAVAGLGSRFVGWTECASVYGARGELCETSLLPGAAVSITATFGNPLLTILGSGSVNGTVSSTSPSGIVACTVTAGATSGDCTEEAAAGTAVTLRATPAAGFQLNGWIGCDSTSGVHGEKCRVTLSGTDTVVAAFRALRS